MSLKIWLTGNGNVENQGCGLLDNPFITSPVYDSGKLGKCIKLTNTGSNMVSLLDEPTSRTFSASYWVRLDSSSYTNWADIFGLRFVTDDGTVNEFREELFIEGSKLYTNFFGPPLTGTAGMIVNGTSNLMTVGEWVHDAITCDGNNLTWYRNNKVIGTYTIASDRKGSVDWQRIHIGSSAAQMSMCDFRLYDHCLSKKEIHEIYKSLILHYPLNNPFGNPNLVPNTFDWDGFYIGSGGSITDEYYHGFRVLKCSVLADDTSAFRDICAFNVAVEPSTTYTLSFYYKGIFFDSFFHPSVVASGKNNTGSTTTRSDGCITAPSTDIWKKYTITWTTLSTVASGTSKQVIPVRMYRGDTDRYGYICGIKFEKSDTVTPWCPNSADEEYSLLGLDSNIIADCSGYGNDGTMSGRYTYAQLSPRYDSFWKLLDGGYINCGVGAKVSDTLTINIWAGRDDWTLPSDRLISCTETGGWSFQRVINSDGDDTYEFVIYVNDAYHFVHFQTLISELSSGWHMFTATYDGCECKIYLDGIFEASKILNTTKSNIIYTCDNSIFLNVESAGNSPSALPDTTNSTPRAMNYSDFRIYATALTADDIKELYQMPFSIDKNGNVFGYNFMEV